MSGSTSLYSGTGRRPASRKRHTLVPLLPPEYEAARPFDPDEIPAASAAAWVDEVTARTDVRPLQGGSIAARVLPTLALVVVMLFLVYLFLPTVSLRASLTNTARFPVATLTALPVELAPILPSRVTEINYDVGAVPDEMISAGTPIAVVSHLDSMGVVQTETIVAPFDARFASIDALVGDIARPERPVATIYDPTRLVVLITMDTENLGRLRRGMDVVLRSASLTDPLRATLDSAVPLLATDYNQEMSPQVNVRALFIVEDQEAASKLVPGVTFEAFVRLGSAPDGVPLVLSTPLLDGEPTTVSTAAPQAAPAGPAPTTLPVVGTTIPPEPPVTEPTVAEPTEEAQ